MKKLVNCVISDTVCNLRCEYCYIGQLNQHSMKTLDSPHSVDKIRKALSYERLGGRCHMNICAAGETLLVPYIVELALAFMEESHIVSIVTNGLITETIDKLCSLDDEKKQNLFLKISFHYKEMKNKNLLEKFFDNIKKIENSNIAFSVELTVNDESIQYIDEILKLCTEKLGSVCHILESRIHDGFNFQRLTKLDEETHIQSWSVFDSELFNFQQTIWGEKRKEFCYAGDWILSVNLNTGDVAPCFGGGNAFDNIYKFMDLPIKYKALGNKCPWGHCYAAYVLLTHGAIPELETPPYSKLRNRITKNNIEWLSQNIQEKFSEKFIESNFIYSNSKKALLNYINGIEYDSLTSEDVEVLIPHLKLYFSSKNIEKIAIYGAGRIGIGLESILKRVGVKVEYFIDRNYENIHLETRCISPDLIADDVDLIVVTAIKNFHDIRNKIMKFNIELISVLDLFID